MFNYSENETYLRFSFVKVCVSLFNLFQKGNIISYTKYGVYRLYCKI